ncbi:SpoIIE family protein phosphatase [Streptomyces sp. NBC_01176]|uniref:SpoIIE family protein phosphatase n=1 Tax=Streptomyces sp. NBC_01176 TaxID=2903760 RepID=UPI00386AFA35|nr:fused response regulator/phosphatase [Streptomyces sp. NBC_01176]
MDGNSRRNGTTTVLVVGGVPDDRLAVSALLRRAGHEVVPVATAAEALRELDTRLREGTLPDVLLVDVRLRDMTGFELCRRLKAHQTLAAVPVVHLSAAGAAPGDHRRSLDSGAEACLTVPAEPEEIQTVVRTVLHAARLRADDQALIRRLTLLSETIVTVQAARSLDELVDAAAEGTARLTGLPAVVFVLGPEGELYRGMSPKRIGLALPDRGAHDAVARLISRLGAGRAVVHRTVVHSPLWPAGFFRPGVQDDARLVLAQGGKAPVCLATPVRDSRPQSPADEAGVARLAQATALAAEPLLMYQVERHVALTLQRSFLPQPDKLPDLPGVDIAVRYEPASQQAEIGGDFYAALRVGDGVLAAVGDVVGHSLDAATVMVEIRHALRAYCVEDSDPAVLAERLDRMLQRYHPEITATVCLVLVEPDTGRVRIANAGHIPPLIVRGSGGADYAKAHGPLLGLGLAVNRPTPAELFLEPSDRLLVVTDGLIETRGTDLALSMEHLRAAVADAPPGVRPLCDMLLDRFGQDREDDVAMLALQLRPGQAKP